MAKRSPFEPSARLQQILDAAREILTTGGVESVRVAALAELVGLSEAALYRHVDSKEEILSLVVEDVRKVVFAGIDAAVEPADKPALRKLEHILQSHLAWLDGKQGIRLMLVTAALQFGKGDAACRARRLMSDYASRVSDIIDEGKTRGEIEFSVNSEAAATMFMGLERAEVNRWLRDPAGTRPLCRSHELWRMYRSSIAARSQPAVGGRLT